MGAGANESDFTDLREMFICIGRNIQETERRLYLGLIMANLFDMIQADGGTLRKMATTGGGEFAGACPFCGGRDRFRAWPVEGRYWCRGCGKAGDSIQYLRERRGLSFVEACKVLGHDPGPRSSGARPAPAAWEPREPKAPLSLWQERARGFLDKAVDCLWSRRGESMRAWLHDVKGLSDATIKAAGLGYNPADIYEPRGTWGFDPILKEDGTERRQWIPGPGLVIPLVNGGAVHRLRIRRSDPGDGPRYVITSGSSAAPMAWGKGATTIIVVESELDAILLNQAAGDLCGVVAMGSAQRKPDTATHDRLTRAEAILVSLDSDDAGAKAAAFWFATYGGKAKRWPTIKGKDASEAWANGLDLRQWITAGLNEGNHGQEMQNQNFN